MCICRYPIKFGIGKDATTVQSILDGIMPGILPLALFGVIYYIFKKDKCNPIVMMLLLMVLGVVGAFFGFLG